MDARHFTTQRRILIYCYFTNFELDSSSHNWSIQLVNLRDPADPNASDGSFPSSNKTITPDLTFLLFDNSGHNPMVEIQEEFDKKLIEWIDSH